MRGHPSVPNVIPTPSRLNAEAEPAFNRLVSSMTSKETALFVSALLYLGNVRAEILREQSGPRPSSAIPARAARTASAGAILARFSVRLREHLSCSNHAGEYGNPTALR